MRSNQLRITLVLAGLLFICAMQPMEAPAQTAGKESFPIYTCLEKAVAFWESVYSRYTTHQGIIHDDRNLDVVYEVVALTPQGTPGAAKHNRRKIKRVKRKYKAILKNFVRGKKPGSAEEKRVWALFGDRASQRTFRQARRGIRFQLGQSDRFKQGIIRSGAYLDEIKRIFKAHDLPEALAYLPHVESSFNYEAYSKFGAAGIWQFTRGTGRHYMTIDYVRDDRRDPIRASHAAAKHLKNNYEKLGNWPLAITAYNHGVNGMVRAKARAGGDFEKIINGYDGRSFGFASRNFYAEFLAAWSVAENYQAYFGELPLQPPVRTTEVVMPSYAAAKAVAKHFGIRLGTLKKLNPALRKPVFSGQKYIPKGYALRLPREIGRNSATLASNLPESLFHKRQRPSRFYRVQRGDTAGKIARSQGVRLSDLILANRLGSRATIYVGQNLRIPVPGETLMLAAATRKPKAAKKKTVAPPKVIPPVVTPTAEVVEAEAPIEAPIAAEPRPKPEMAEKPAEVMVAAVTPEVTAPPTEPVVTADAEAPPSLPAEINPEVVMGNLQVEKVSGEGRKTVGIIRVEAEETLGHYADWIGIPTQSIRRLNGFRYGTPIRTGERIKIPLGKTDKATFEERRYEYHKELEEDFFSAYHVDGEFIYEVKRGDNIWTLCQQTFELPFWLIKKFNPGQDFKMLNAGQRLKIPTVQKAGEEKA